MSNTSTLVDTINSQIGGIGPLYEYEIAIDTTATDLDIRTPSVTANRVFVVGLWIADGASLNLTLKSKTTDNATTSKSQTFELAANQGNPGFCTDGFYFATKPGEKLTIQSSVAVQSSVGKNLVIRVAEGCAFRVN